MAKQEISGVDFRDLVTVVPGSTPVKFWSPVQPAHSPAQGKQAIREIVGPAGETLAVVISYEAGTVKQEVKVPAANIAGVVYRPVVEPVAKAVAK